MAVSMSSKKEAKSGVPRGAGVDGAVLRRGAAGILQDAVFFWEGTGGVGLQQASTTGYGSVIPLG